MKSEKGFTLIEIMVTLAIVAVIAAAVYNAYFGSLRAWEFNNNRLEVQRVQDLTDRWISQYARKAIYVNPDYTDTDLTTDQNILHLKYNDNGTTKEVAFGRGSNQSEDYLYFYNIDSDSQRKISDLKFSALSFAYSDDLIKMQAEIFNEEENSTYKFSSYFNPRLAEIVTP